MKKPKLSEIRAREQRVPWTVEAITDFIDHTKTDIPYLLDLVERLGRIIRDDVNPIAEVDVIRVRALLEELKH